MLVLVVVVVVGNFEEGASRSVGGALRFLDFGGLSPLNERGLTMVAEEVIEEGCR